MNPIELMKNAEKMSVQQLQQSVENGTLPAYIGVPLIQEKVKQQQQMQTAGAAQQGPQPSVKDQIMQQAGVTQLPSGLPQEYANGGIVGFAKGGVPRSLSEQLEELIAEQQADEFRNQGWTEEAIKNYQSKGNIESMSRRYLAPTEQPYNSVTSEPSLLEKQTRAAMNARVPAEDVIEMPPYQERVDIPTKAARDLALRGKSGFGAAPEYPGAVSGEVLPPEYPGAVSGEVLPPETPNISGALPKPTTTVNGASFEMPSITPRADYATKYVEGLSGNAYRPFNPEAEKWFAGQETGPGFQQKAAPTITEPVSPASGIRGILQNTLRKAGQTGFLITPEMTEQVYDVGNQIAQKHGFGPNVPKQDKKVPTRGEVRGYGGDMLADKQAEAWDYINEAALNRPNVDPRLALAVAEQESSYNTKAKAPGSTAGGYMQVTDAAMKDAGFDPKKDNRFDPRVGSQAGVNYLSKMLDISGGDTRLALARYHLGPNAPMEKLKNDPYVDQVLARYKGAKDIPPRQFDTSHIPPGDSEQQAQGVAASPVQQGQAPGQPQSNALAEYEQAANAALYNQDELDPAKIIAQRKALLGEDTGITALKGKIAEMEAKHASAEDKAPWLALMQAGLATMAGTSPYAAVNIGQGAQTGLSAYAKSQDRLEEDALKRYKLEADLASAQRNYDVAVATKGIESAEARAQANKVNRIETAKFKQNEAQQERQLTVQESAEKRLRDNQDKYDMIEGQAQRYIADGLSPTEAYSKASQMFATSRSGGMSEANRTIINLRGLIQTNIQAMGKVPNQYSAEGKAKLAALQQQNDEYKRQIESLMQGGGQTVAPSGTTSRWSNFQQVSR